MQTRTPLVLISAILLASLAAHAAPSAPKTADPQLKPGVLRPPVAAVQQMVSAQITPSVSKCGEPRQLQLMLTNKTSAPWEGSAAITGSPAKTVSLAASGPEATKVLTLAGPVTDCTRPLNGHEVKAWATANESKPIFVKTVSPKTVRAERALSAPPPNDTRVWLRRVMMDLTCGGPASSTALLQAFGPTEQSATVKLSFGPASKDGKVPVQANTPTPVKLDASQKFDCQAPAGIPTFDYALLSGITTSGALSAAEVTFE